MPKGESLDADLWRVPRVAFAYDDAIFVCIVLHAVFMCVISVNAFRHTSFLSNRHGFGYVRRVNYPDICIKYFKRSNFAITDSENIFVTQSLDDFLKRLESFREKKRRFLFI